MRTELYIDGKWVKGTSTIPVYDPADGSVIADVQLADDALCEAAITAAHNAQVEWAKTTPRYRAEILEVGGSRPAAESFKAFRGREPSIDALLRHGGLA